MPATGCLPLTPQSRRVLDECRASAVSLPEYTWQDRGDMPIIKWDCHFDAWLDRRIQKADDYAGRGKCLLPWEIFKKIPKRRKRSEILFWNQQSRPSCCLHGHTHAYQMMTVMSIALGAPLHYEAFNPIYPFALAKGGSMAGGLDLITAAKWTNEKGQYPVSIVGDDNVNLAADYTPHAAEAKGWQAGIVFIEGDLQEKITRACHGLCAVNFGSGHYFSSFKTDANGVKVMDQSAPGGHAQCNVGYRVVNHETYIGDINSHGNRHGQSAEGEPACFGWLSEKQVASYCRDMPQYGDPYIVFVEGEFDENPKLYNDFDLPNLPKNWLE